MANQFIKNLEESVKYWYIPLIVGIILIGTGIWTFFSPLNSYLALSFIFSISFLSSGMLEIIFAVTNRQGMDNWGWSLVLGFLTALVGILLLARPEISMLTLPLYVGFLIMFRSFGAIAIAIDLKNYGVLEWGTLMVIGVLGLIFSFILIWNPVFAGITIVFWTGLALLASGVFHIFAAFKMRNLHKHWDDISKEVRERFEEAKEFFKRKFNVLKQNKFYKMNQLQIFSTIVLLVLIHSCSTPKNKVIWVGGIKSECSAGAGKMQCLKVHKGENLDDENWENFYTNIEGFEFEEGFIKKLEIREEKIENPPADGSSIKYIMVKELEKQVDYRAQINGDWTLNRINDAPINRSMKLPNLMINLSQMQLSGTGGCNNYNSQITELTSKTVNFGNIVNTSRACIIKNIEQEYFSALNSVGAYQIEGDNLILYDAKGNKILSYMKGIKKEPNQRIHDIWTAVRINGNPINRMAPTPTMEINLTNMKVAGNDGCNEYTGDIKEVSDNQITFGLLASTKKMCRKMETAESYNAAMNQVASYRLEELNLILMDAENKEVLAFLKGD